MGSNQESLVMNQSDAFREVQEERCSFSFIHFIYSSIHYKFIHSFIFKVRIVAENVPYF